VLNTSDSHNSRVSLALLGLRLSVFFVMLMWTIDKLINVEHAQKVYQHFYFISDLGDTFIRVLGGLELLILIGFVLGYKKRLSYGLVFIFHLISTLSSFKQYFSPFEPMNLLFFAAWPMLAACFALYILRDEDTRCLLN
jgi:putative oxidoreductase